MYRNLCKYPKEFAAILWATPYSPDNWRNARPSERLLIAASQQFYSGNCNSSTWAIDKCAAPRKPKPAVWADWCKRVLPFAARMKDVQILCEDAIKTIERVSGDADALIYVDPPYLGHEKEYRYQVDYQQMINALLKAKAKVLVSEYEAAISFFPGWDVVKKRTAGRARTGAHKTKAKIKTECLIANFNLIPNK